MVFALVHVHVHVGVFAGVPAFLFSGRPGKEATSYTNSPFYQVLVLALLCLCICG